MARSTKVHHYIAFPDVASADTLWDMLRYDRCHPVSNTPQGWMVLKQPYLEGVRGGFTVARWESFAIRFALGATASVHDGGHIPFDLLTEMQRLSAGAATAGEPLYRYAPKHARQDRLLILTRGV